MRALGCLLLCIALVALSHAAPIEYVPAAGATFPAQVYESWASSYIAERPNLRVTYNRTGSGTGQSLIIEGKDVVFAGSDSLLSAAQYDTVPDLQMMPWVSGGVVAFTKSFEGLVLSRFLLAEIFIGNIQYWDDERIQELNPTITLPRERITVIYREEKSGTTEVWTTALSKFSDEWAERFGVSSVWPDELIANTDRYLPAEGNGGVFTLSTLTPYSISYLSYSFIENSLSQSFYVRLINKAGNVVLCTTENVIAATQNTNFDDRFTADITDSAEPNAWPIATFTYIIVRRESTSPELCDEFWHGVEFLNYAIQYYIPQILVSLNGFSDVSPAIREKELEIMRNLRCNGEQRFNPDLIPAPAPEEPTPYYNTLVDFYGIEEVSYSPFFDSIGSSISQSDAEKYEPSTITSLDEDVYDLYDQNGFQRLPQSAAPSRAPQLSLIALFAACGILINRSRWSLLLVGLFVVAMVAPTHAQLRVAGFYPLTGRLSAYGSSAESAVRLAVLDLNEDLNITLITKSYNTATDPGQGLQALTEARSSFNMFGVVGPHDDLTASTVALTSTLYYLPQIAYGAQGNFLTATSDYPYFSRVIPAYHSEGYALASIVRLYGWKNIGVIFAADDYGVGTTDRLRTNLPDDVLVTYVQFTPGDQALDAQMQVLRNANVRVIVMLPSSAADGRQIFLEAYRYHLVGEQFIWFGGSFVSDSSFFYDDVAEETADLPKSLARGLIAVKLTGGHGPRFEEFLDTWEKLDPRMYSGAGKRSISLYAPFAYDAMELLVRTFASGNFSTVEQFLLQTRLTQFVGLTGPILLSETYSRLAIFDIVNLHRSEEGDHGFVTVGRFTESDELAVVGSGVVFKYQPTFASGSTQVPDVEVRPSVRYWSCSENAFFTDETGKVRLDAPGPDADKLADFYHCDLFIDCYNFSDETYECESSNWLALFIVFGIMTGVLVLFALSMLCFTIVFGYIRPLQRVLSGSLPFLIIIVLSIIVGYTSVYAWFGQPHPVACGFQPWLLGLPVVCMVAALTAKNIRIWRIFRSPLKRQKISDAQVLGVWLLMVIPAIFILFLWTLISTPTATLEERDGHEHYVCQTGGFTGPPGGIVFFAIFVAYVIFLLFLGAIVSFLTRKVPSMFNESRLIAISIYNLVILAGIIIPIYFVLQYFNPFVAWIIRSLAILYGFSATLVLMFVPKVWGVYRDGFQNASNRQVISSTDSQSVDSPGMYSSK